MPVYPRHQPEHIRRSLKKAVPLLLCTCLLIAVSSVLLFPLLVGGSAPVDVSAASSKPQEYNVVSVTNYKEAQQQLGFSPKMPANVPEEYKLTALRILDNSILEAEYTSGKEKIIYRTAPGNEDLSGDTKEYPYTKTETVGDVARGYAGVAEKKLNIAVWATDGNSYAVMSKDGVDAEILVHIAESV